MSKHKHQGRPVPPPAGLGVARAAIQPVLDQELGCTFAPPEPCGATEAVYGARRSTGLYVSLVGPAADLQKVSACLAMPDLGRTNLDALARLMALAAPHWPALREHLEATLRGVVDVGGAHFQRGEVLVTVLAPRDTDGTPHVLVTVERTASAGQVPHAEGWAPATHNARLEQWLATYRERME